MRPKVLFVSRTRHAAPLAGVEARKFAAVGRLIYWHLLAKSRRGYAADQITLLGATRPALLDGIVFNLRLPFAIARVIRRGHPDVVVAQDPYIAAAALFARMLARRDVAVVCEVHGDWRTATSLYGRRARRALASPAAALARWAIRHSDARRAVSNYTADLIRAAGGTVDGQFRAFLDLDAFVATPPVAPPEQPTALFVGVLERYKNIDGLLAAWPLVRAAVPTARLRIVGRGTLAPLVTATAKTDPSIAYEPTLPHEAVAAALDASSCLVLPSRSEGMGRVLVEALARGRAVIGTDSGGIPELVHNGENGLVVTPDDPTELAAALARVLGDRALAAELGGTAFARAAEFPNDQKTYARSLRTLVELARSRRGYGMTERSAESIATALASQLVPASLTVDPPLADAAITPQPLKPA